MAEALRKIIDFVTDAKGREEKRASAEAYDRSFEEYRKFAKVRDARKEVYRSRFQALFDEGYMIKVDDTVGNLVDFFEGIHQHVALEDFIAMVKRDKGRTIDFFSFWTLRVKELYEAIYRRKLPKEKYDEAKAFLKENITKMDLKAIEFHISTTYNIQLFQFGAPGVPGSMRN